LATAAIVACAGCSGGTGSGAAASVPTAMPMPTPTPLTILAGPRAYSGTRIVTVTGSPPPRTAGTASYAAGAVETDLPPGSTAPAGTTLDRRLQVTYTGGTSPAGMLLQKETLDRFAATGSAGLSLLAQSEVTVALDQNAAFAAGQQFTDTRSVTTTYPSAPAVVPAATGTVPPFPLAAGTHLVEQSIETAGTFLGDEAFDIDYARTTNADGSFDENGSNDAGASHAKHQNADGSATSSDSQPGFSLRDVAVSAPSGVQLAVTLQTQGRVIGNPPPPIVTATFTTPVWYAPGPLAAAVLTDSVGQLPAACGLSSPVTARRLSLASTAVDVTAGTRVVTNDQNYLDANGITLCRAVSTVTSVFDVTTGALTATIDDELTLHYTGSAQASSSVRRGTR